MTNPIPAAHRAALALVLLAPATLLPEAAHAEPFTLFIYETASDIALRTDATGAGAAYWAGYATFGAEAQAAGILRGGAALQTDSTAFATLSAAGTNGGAFVTAPLSLGGYFQIDVPDLATAELWAAKLPASGTGAVEIRAGYPVPGM